MVRLTPSTILDTHPAVKVRECTWKQFLGSHKLIASFPGPYRALIIDWGTHVRVHSAVLWWLWSSFGRDVNDDKNGGPAARDMPMSYLIDQRLSGKRWWLVITLFCLPCLYWYWTSLWQLKVVMVLSQFSILPRTVPLKCWDSFALSLTVSPEDVHRSFPLIFNLILLY